MLWILLNIEYNFWIFLIAELFNIRIMDVSLQIISNEFYFKQDVSIGKQSPYLISKNGPYWLQGHLKHNYLCCICILLHLYTSYVYILNSDIAIYF